MAQHLTRRQLMIKSCSVGAVSLLLPARLGMGDDSIIGPQSNPAVTRLKLGNRRFVEERPKHFREGREWRKNLISKQHPFAVILGCADSRVPIELIFDQGFGDLFVIRNAGNVVMDDVLGSIEYAILHLHTKLVVVMGHEGCGAVTAAMKSREERAKEPPELQSILGLIDPALDTLQDKEKGVVARGVEANVRWSVKNMIRLRGERKHGGDCSVVGAVYELKSGHVRFLDDSKASKNSP